MEKVLSICIPTYQRKEEIKRLLKSIEKNIGGFEKEVEVCISDNGSGDGKPEYLEKYGKESSFGIKLFLGGKNEGVDANIFRVLGMASGKWLWMMGDDDQILEGGLEEVLDFLKKINGEDTAVVYLRTKGDERREETVRVGEAEELVRQPNGFLSTTIIRKTFFDRIDKSKLKAGVGTLYPNCWILRLIGIQNPGCKILEYPKPVVNAEPLVKDDGVTSQLEYSKSRIRLSQELRYAGAGIYQYAQFFWQNKTVGTLWKKYLFFAVKKIFGRLFFPFFEITCEREFRKNEDLEKIDFGFFIKIFGVLGTKYYIYRVLITALPLGLNKFLLGTFLWWSKLLRITKENNYEFWKKYWAGQS